MRSIFSLGVVGVVALLAGACAASGGSDGPPSSSGGGPSSSVPSDHGSVVPASMLERVVADAATIAGVAPEEVRVVSEEATTWGDGSLGCPEPGVVYAQVLVEGYRVILEAGGRQLDYRIGGPRNFRLCNQP